MATSLLRAGPLAADFVSGSNRPTFGVRNGHRIAKFPDGVVTETFFTLNMPTVFANGDIEVKIHWMAESAIVGDVVWAVAFERHQPGVDDLDTDSFAADVVAAAETTAGASGQTVETVIPVSAAQYDGLVQGSQFRLRVRRLGSDGGDTMVDIAQLMTVVIEQLADPAGGGGGGFFTDGAGTRAGIGQGSPAPVAAGLEGLAHGTSASAGGANSFAFGPSADAAAIESLSFGANSYVDVAAVYGVALGRGAQVRAAGLNGVAIGRGAQVKGLTSIAIGYNSEAADNAPITSFAVALGYNARGIGEGAIAIGKLSQANSSGAIAIGSGAFVLDGADGIAIGRDAYVSGPFNSNRSIALGEQAHALGADAISIGPRGYAQNADILIGGGLKMLPSRVPYGSSFSNIVVSCGYTQGSGLETYTGSAGSNIIMNTQGGSINTYGAANFQGNSILLSTNNSYIYGKGYRNINIGASSEIGNRGNTTAQVNGNISIGYSQRTASYSASYYTYYAINIGSGSYINHGKGMVAIGFDCNLYGYAGAGSGFIQHGHVAIGSNNKVYGDRANTAIGYYCEIKSNTAIGTYINARGNLALGYYCVVQNLLAATNGTGSAMAQGSNANTWIGGQRSFSSNRMSGGFTTIPEQGSFTVAGFQTVNATPVAMFTFPTFADKAYTIWGWVIVRNTTTDSENAAFSLPVMLISRNAAGAPVLTGTGVLVKDQAEGAGAAAWAAALAISGNNFVVNVTGDAADTLEWCGWFQVLETKG